MGLADQIIVVSQSVKASMSRRGITENTIQVVCNGTLGSPRDRYSSRAEPLPSVVLQRPAIVTVAGMYRRKGIAELIAAFAEVATEFPQVHLYLVGNGPDRRSLKPRQKPPRSAISSISRAFNPNLSGICSQPIFLCWHPIANPLGWCFPRRGMLVVLSLLARWTASQKLWMMDRREFWCHQEMCRHWQVRSPAYSENRTY